MSELPSLHQRFITLSQPIRPKKTRAKPVLQSMTDIRAVIYDFYGTLFISGVGDIGIDDGKPDSRLFRDALKTSGVQIIEKKAGRAGYRIYNRVVKQIAENMQKNGGSSYPEPDIRAVWEQVLDEMMKEKLIDIPLQQYPSEQLAIEFELRMNPIWPMPGAIETLSYFKEKGLFQGIISNSQFYTPVALEALTGNSLEELGFHPGLLHWSYQEKMKKPGIPFYETFLEKLHKTDPSIKPQQVLYIGNDMLKDIWPANEVGLKTALFAGDKRSLKWRKYDERCKNLKPDLVITEFSQLRESITL